jgi:hypothetical protein
MHVRLQLRASGILTLIVKKFLIDAANLGVFRPTGAIHDLRHQRIQNFPAASSSSPGNPDAVTAEASSRQET